MIQKKILMTAFFTCMALAIITGCDRSNEKEAGQYQGSPEKIIVADAQQPVGSLIYIADQNGYFKSEGLDVTFQQHASGKSALNSVLAGKADFATTAETPVIHAVLAGENPNVIATILTTEKTTAVIARKGRGISSTEDLRGKIIGVTTGTNAEFYLDSLLLVHSVDKDAVTIINLKPEEIFDALIQGQVDAASIWNPHLFRLQKELSGDGITFYAQGIYTMTWNIAAMQGFVTKRPAAARKLLRALLKAETFLRKNREASQKIVADYLQLDGSALNELWDTYNFKLTLDKSLLLALEDQTRWAIKNKLTDKTEVPNYLDYIHVDALKAVNPVAVTIIH